MIFATVGSQLHFDRMIQMIDEVAAGFPQFSFIAQTGDSKFEAKHLKTFKTLSPAQFAQYLHEADLVISHAGVGTILQVSEAGKPLIVFPRMAQLHEARNDHQVATCNMLKENLALHVATQKPELESLLTDFAHKGLTPMPCIQHHASASLLKSLQENITEITAHTNGKGDIH